MKYIITVDAGTTNTRAILFDEQQQMKAMESRGTGVRNTAIDGSNHRLRTAVRECLEGLLAKENISYQEVSMIIASGMITSNVGLVEIPHLTAPVGINELAAGVQSVFLEDVCPIPIHFIPGIKNTSVPITLENYESMDIMRGEETESVALINSLPAGHRILIVLPGSHTKFVSVNEAGQITGCLTTLSGELLSVVTNNTIIADAVGHQFVQEETCDTDLLLAGYQNARKTGLGRACFSCRILSQFTDLSKEKLASYLLGVILSSDVLSIRNSNALCVDRSTIVLVAGKDPLRGAICEMLRADGYFSEVIGYDSTGDIPLSGKGALLIAHQKNLL